MTYPQAQTMDTCVRKGERSSVVVYYGTAKARDAEDRADGGGARSDEGDDGDASAYRFLKSYRVFNATQIDGLDACFHPEAEGDPADGREPIPACQAFFDAIGADVSVGGDRACYVPALDRIHMPPMARFESAEKFYATLGHEHVHYTKAPDRLDRSFGVSTFGSEA
jgi:antirestriction protein ArdC